MSYLNSVTVAELEARVKQLQDDCASLPQERSGQRSNYYAPAIAEAKRLLNKKRESEHGTR